MGVNATLFYLGITCARVGCLQRGLLCSDVPDVRRSALGSACKEKAFLEGCWMRASQGILSPAFRRRRGEQEGEIEFAK